MQAGPQAFLEVIVDAANPQAISCSPLVTHQAARPAKTAKYPQKANHCA